MPKLEFELEDIKKNIQVTIRKGGKGDTKLNDLLNEPGQQVLKFDNKKNVYVLDKLVFSIKRKVEDELRFFSNGIFFKEAPVGYVPNPAAKRAVIILESPHKEEFGYNYQHFAIRPANGVTGVKIKNVLNHLQIIYQLINKENTNNTFNVPTVDPKSLAKIIKQVVPPGL